MKVHIIHDDAGNIRGTLIPLSDETEIGVRVASPLGVLLIDRADMPDHEKQRFLADLHSLHKVQLDQNKLTLMRIKERKRP